MVHWFSANGNALKKYQNKFVILVEDFYPIKHNLRKCFHCFITLIFPSIPSFILFLYFQFLRITFLETVKAIRSCFLPLSLIFHKYLHSFIDLQTSPSSQRDGGQGGDDYNNLFPVYFGWICSVSCASHLKHFLLSVVDYV